MNPLEEEKEILSNFSYKENLAVIHTDDKVMPRNKEVWSSWNSCINYNNIAINSITMQLLASTLSMKIYIWPQVLQAEV